MHICTHICTHVQYACIINVCVRMYVHLCIYMCVCTVYMYLVIEIEWNCPFVRFHPVSVSLFYCPSHNSPPSLQTQIPSVAVDYYYFGRLLVAPLNIVLYNVFGKGGPDLYGTEKFSYYIFNGILNFNILFPFALLGTGMGLMKVKPCVSLFILS